LTTQKSHDQQVTSITRFKEVADVECAEIKNYGQSFRASKIKPLGGTKVRCMCLTLHNANSPWPATDPPRRPRPTTLDRFVIGSPLFVEAASRTLSPNAIQPLIVPAPRGTTITGKKA
jgi:hypothetical protein